MKSVNETQSSAGTTGSSAEGHQSGGWITGKNYWLKNSDKPKKLKRNRKKKNEVASKKKRGFIKRERNPYKGGDKDKVNPKQYDVLESSGENMSQKLRETLQVEIRNVLKENPHLADRLGQRLGFQVVETEAPSFGLSELAELHSSLTGDSSCEHLKSAYEYANKISEDLCDESNENLSTKHDGSALKRNAAYLKKLGEELKNNHETMAEARRASLAIVDEIGHLGNRYFGDM